MSFVPKLVLPNDNTLLDKAVESLKEKEKNDGGVFGENDKTILVLGGNSSGKSSFIVQTFGLDDEITPTVALKYYFSEFSQDYEQNMCNIWEIGGGTTFSPTLYAIENMPNMTAVVVVDLSMPQSLVGTLDSCFEVLASYLNRRNDRDDLRKKASQRIRPKHPDIDVIEPFPIPLVIIGSKYDLFQALDPEQKRVICSFLRYTAHSRGAFLIFYSYKIGKIVKKAKEIFEHYAYNLPSSNTNPQFDHNLPLLVPPGRDSFEAIDKDGGDSYDATTYEKLKTSLERHFAQEDPKNYKFPKNPSTDPDFKEFEIDNLKKQKFEWLLKMEEEMKMNMEINDKIIQDE